MRRSLIIAFTLALALTACSLGAPVRKPPALPTLTATHIPAPAATRPAPSPTPAPAQQEPTLTPTASPTAAAVPATLERQNLAVISTGNAARLELLAAFRPGPQLRVTQPLFFPDDSRLAFALVSAAEGEARSATIYIWILSSALPQQILDASSRELAALALAPGASTLAAAGPAGLRLWDTTTWQPLPGPAAAEAPSALAFGPAGDWLAYALSPSGKLTLWEIGPQVERWSAESAHAGGVSALAASADGAWLASAGLDGALRLWNTLTGEDERELAASAGAVTGLAFTPNGQELLAYDKTGALLAYRLSDGRPARSFQACSSGLPGCTAPAFSPDRAILALSDPAHPDGPGVRLWDAQNGALLATLATAPALDPLRIASVAFSPDGRLLAIGSQDGALEVWGVSGGLFTAGAHLRVTEPGDGLNLRDRPALGGSIRSQLAKGEALTLLEGPVLAGGFNWWRIVTAQNREGWIVEVPEWFEKGE